MNNYLAQPKKNIYPRPTSTDTSLWGCVSEIYYRSESATSLNTRLLPLLLQLGHQSRWQLWISPLAKISRKWLTESGLPIGKSVQLTSLGQEQNINATIRALASGNFSIVVACFAERLTQHERASLETAALDGQCTAIILLPESQLIAAQRQENNSLIPSNLFH